MIECADVEVIFVFNGERKRNLMSGYRPAHLLADGYLTTGIHKYFGVNSVAPNGIVEGTIRSISSLSLDWKKD